MGVPAARPDAVASGNRTLVPPAGHRRFETRYCAIWRDFRRFAPRAPKWRQAYFDAHAEQWDQIRSLHIAEAEVEAAMRAMLGEYAGWARCSTSAPAPVA
jgi:hypothetical protein